MVVPSLGMTCKVNKSPLFTLDACRHGGMTELEEAELTDGQGRALSGHRTQQSYEGYAKRTLARALPAARKRHAHRLSNDTGQAVSELDVGVSIGLPFLNARKYSAGITEAQRNISGTLATSLSTGRFPQIASETVRMPRRLKVVCIAASVVSIIVSRSRRLMFW